MTITAPARDGVVVTAYQSGMKMAEIADEYDLSLNMVFRILDRADLPPRMCGYCEKPLPEDADRNRKYHVECAEAVRKEQARAYKKAHPTGRKAEGSYAAGDVASPCFTCPFLQECKNHLWEVQETVGGGVEPVPLRCFVDHPEHVPVNSNVLQEATDEEKSKETPPQGLRGQEALRNAVGGPGRHDRR